jgi:PAS domain S-box-containing protein
MTQQAPAPGDLERELASAKARIAELEAQLGWARPASGGDGPPAGADRDTGARELLHLFATATTRSGYLDSVRDLLVRWTGCQCVGIRLVDAKRRIPYESYRGFDRAFWERENWLDLDRSQCVCVRVIKGTPDPQDMPYVSPGGSFVCSDADEMINRLDPQEIKRFRGVCMNVGYKSVAVLPLRYRSQIIGAVHMADRQCGKFREGIIQFIETVSPLIGEAVHRFDIEDSLRQSHELLERTFEGIDLHLAYMDRDFNFIRVNRGYAEIDGRTPDYYVGRNHFDLFPNAENERLFRRVVETGEPYFVLAKPFDYAYNPERGTTYWDWSLQPVKRPDGIVEGVVLSLVNVTDRERALASLREREVLFRAVFDQTFQFMALLTTEGRVLELNRASAELLNLRQPGECPLLWELPGWGGRRRGLARLKQAIAEAAQGHTIQYEAEVGGADGRHLTIDLSVKPVRDASGAVSYLIAEGRDITERKQLESELLEVSSREQRRIGHDLHDVLGQNLTGLAFLNRILEQRLSEKHLTEAEDAARVGDGIRQAIAQARGLSRGLCPIDQKPDGLMTALQALAGNVTELYGISCLFQSNRPVLVADMAAATHLYHIAQEAVNNAIKHSKADQIRIGLHDDGDSFHLSVRDNGSGIPARSKKTGGLGLNIMKYRAGMIGASLEVNRHPEGGTLVTCTCRDIQTANPAGKEAGTASAGNWLYA